MTLLDFLSDALILTGAVEQGQGMSPEEAQWSLRAFNGMLDSLNTERLNICSIDENDYPLVAHKGSYTVGTGLDINTTRPVLIQQIKILYAGLGFDCDMLSSVQWAAITETDNEAKLPTKAYYDNAFPIPTINLNPIPLCPTATSIDLFTWHPLSQLTDLTAPLVFPTGYQEPLQYMLAARLGPPEGMQLAQSVVDIANNSMNRLRQLNAQILAGPFNTTQAALQAPAVGLPAGPPQQ